MKKLHAKYQSTGLLKSHYQLFDEADNEIARLVYQRDSLTPSSEPLIVLAGQTFTTKAQSDSPLRNANRFSMHGEDGSRYVATYRLFFRGYNLTTPQLLEAILKPKHYFSFEYQLVQNDQRLLLIERGGWFSSDFIITLEADVPPALVAFCLWVVTTSNDQQAG